MNLVTALLPYLGALLATIIIEGILCFLLLKNKSWLKFVCLVNLFTNPLVNFLYSVLYLYFTRHDRPSIMPLILFLLEIMVWLSEAWLFYRFSNRKKPLPSMPKALCLSDLQFIETKIAFSPTDQKRGTASAIPLSSINNIDYFCTK